MARLNDESHSIPEGQRHPSDQILSPQPCVPPSKEHLLASFETSHMHLHDPETLTDDGQMSRDYEYPSSSSSTRHSTSDIFGREMDDELDQMKSRASSRSSFSSIPASVLIHPLEKINSMRSMNPHEKMAAYTIEDDEARFGGFDDPPKTNIRTIRQREGAFRKPSSVRAMQMHTEDEADDDEYLTPPRRRGGMRSPGSGSGGSPLKRSPYYSPTAAAKNQPKPKKEYPLVLLHCNLLAPSLPVQGASLPQNQNIVEETLPSEYWKRWRRLQEKVGSGVLRDRGVLISHPEDLYDMLEERLLESLELQRSRLHQGHFLGHEENGTGSGPGSDDELSDRDESETDGEQGDECPDCGSHVQRHSDSNRKWEIRVFAANGLMRAGAWAAAWKEMEKVDVEVGLWLPSDVRRTLEKRLAEEQTTQTEDLTSSPSINQARTDIDPHRLSIQSHSRSGSDPRSFQSIPPSKPVPASESQDPEPVVQRSQPTAKRTEETKSETKQPQIALQTLLVNYIRVLAGDRRNIALVFMSILVVFLAIGASPQPTQLAMPEFSSGVVDFSNDQSMTAEASRISPTASTLSAESILALVPASSVLISESVAAVIESSSSFQKETPGSSLAGPETTSVMHETESNVSESVPQPTEAASPSTTEVMDSPVPTPEAEGVSVNSEPSSFESTSTSATLDEHLPSSTPLPDDESFNVEEISPETPVPTTESAEIDSAEDLEELPIEPHSELPQTEEL